MYFSKSMAALLALSSYFSNVDVPHHSKQTRIQEIVSSQRPQFQQICDPLLNTVAPSKSRGSDWIESIKKLPHGTTIASQVTSREIALAYELVKLKSSLGRRESLCEEYLAELKKRFGELTEKNDNFDPEINKRVDQLSINYAKGIYRIKTEREYQRWRADHFAELFPIQKERKKIEMYFNDLFFNHPEFDHKSVADQAMDTLLFILKDGYATYFKSLQEFKKAPYKTMSRYHLSHYDDKKIIVDQVLNKAEEEIQEGDQLLEINHVPVTDIKYLNKALASTLQGAKNSTFKIKRGTELLEIRAPFEKFYPGSMIFSNRVGDTGIITIRAFWGQVAENFQMEFEQFAKHGVKNIILDLRGVKQGAMRECFSTLEKVMKNKIIGFFRYNDGEMKRIYSSNQNFLFETFPHMKETLTDYRQMKIPVIVLANMHTEGIGEVAVNALRDNLQAPIIGSTTAGKGYDQKFFVGPLLGIMGFSVSESVSPLGNHFHQVGILPNYKAVDPSAQMLAALRYAGIQKFHVEVREHAVKINNLSPSFSYSEMIEKEGKTYVIVEVLAAPLLIAWENNPNTHKMKMEDEKGNKYNFTSIQVKGLPYLAVEDFAKSFPNMSYHKIEDKLLLEFS